MLLVALVSWWYTTAWNNLGKRVEQRLATVMSFFSVGLLFRTLFDPFRQIAAAQTKGSIDAQFRAWGDRLFSRAVGFVVRSIFIVFGLLAGLLTLLFGGLQIILWPFVPLLPVIGIVGFVGGITL